MAGGSTSSNCREVVPLHTWILLSQFKMSYRLFRRPDGTFDRDAAEFHDRTVTSNAIPVDGVSSFDVIIDQGRLLARIYKPANSEVPQPYFVIDLERPVADEVGVEVLPVIVFFHGGSFAHSNVNSCIYDVLCRKLVKICKAVVVSVDYRRSPENRFPCAYDDGWIALQWVNSRSWLKSPRDSRVHIYLAGDSSGGNIVHNVTLRVAECGIELLGNILINPMFGGLERTESEKRLDGKYFVTIEDRDWYWRAFLPEEEDRDHPACNPFGPRAQSIEAVNFPKSLVVVAGFDPLRDWQLAYAEGLKKSGKKIELLYLEQATIGFYLLPNNDHYHTVMDAISSFVRSDS